MEKHLRGYDVSRLLVIYTGGTIGMMDTKDGYRPVPNHLSFSVRQMNLLHDANACAGESGTENKPFVLPAVKGYDDRIEYVIYEYSPLLDSSDMTHLHWCSIAQDIADCYHLFSGFVVLHGTDTLAYTASALSFMLQDLGKSVIITGAQIPIYEARSDGRENFTGDLSCYLSIFRFSWFHALFCLVATILYMCYLGMQHSVIEVLYSLIRVPFCRH